jgi:hypothetical protein
VGFVVTKILGSVGPGSGVPVGPEFGLELLLELLELLVVGLALELELELELELVVIFEGSTSKYALCFPGVETIPFY